MSKQYLIFVTPLWCVEMIDADQTRSEKNVGGLGLYIEVVRPLVHVSVPPPFPTPIIVEYGDMWDLFTRTHSIVSDARNKGI